MTARDPRAPALNWQGIAIGVGAGFAIGFVGSRLPDLMQVGEHPDRIGTMIVLMNALGVAGSIVCGAIAGWHGAHRAALHGAIAGGLEIALGFSYGLVVGLLREPSMLSYLAEPGYWIAIVPWWLTGWGLAIVAAHLAGKRRRRA